jgi:DNA invertase Pin-like site-specific DNA recombinase
MSNETIHAVSAMEQERAGLYARVSPDAQETDGHMTELRRYAAAFGWRTVKYVDHGGSGHRDNRTALDRMLHDARAGKINVVLAWRLDRLGRSLRHVVHLVTTLRDDMGVRVVSPGDGFDSANELGSVLLGVLAGFAESESRRISARCRLNIAARKARGERVGRIPTIHIAREQLDATASLSVRAAAKALGVTPSAVFRARKEQAATA